MLWRGRGSLMNVGEGWRLSDECRRRDGGSLMNVGEGWRFSDECRGGVEVL